MEGPTTESIPIMKFLKSICDYSHWNYAVFWKLNHHFPMTLTWENGYCGDQKTNEAVETMWSEMVSSSSGSSNSSPENSVRLLMTEMSRLKYTFGEGVVGKIALTGDHCWVSCDDLFTRKIQNTWIPECPYELLLQFTSIIQTIVLVPVLPQGVLQFGSSEAVSEDLAFVANIKEKFNSIHCLAPNTAAPLSSDESSSSAQNILIGELFDGVSLNINELSGLNPTVPSFAQVKDLMSGKSETGPPSTGPSDDICVEMKLDDIEKVLGETSTCVFSYPCKDMAEQHLGCTHTDHKGCKNLISFFNFPLDSELHKALGTIANIQTAESESKYLSVEDTYSSSSTLISHRKEHDPINDLQFSKEGDTEYLLDAIIGSLHSASDDSTSILPIVGTDSIHPQSHSEESTLAMVNANSRSHLSTSAYVAEDTDGSTNFFTSASLDGHLSVLLDDTQQEAMYRQPKSVPKLSSSGKKRAKVIGKSQRPRPRDRQLIMDRMKELRELVPDGAKCSIDNLLERTIKHVLYLRKVTDQAEKLRQCEHQEVPKFKKQKTDAGHTGRSCAIDFESEPQVCPIVIEDLEYPGYMLIEMICSENGLFLEIAQVIRQLDLTILKGVLETRSSTAWARFIVQIPRGFHRMDVLCPLLNLLQRRRNPTNRI